MTENDVPPEVSAYMARIGRKGGAKSIAKVNAKLTTAQRKRAGKKGAANSKLTPGERSARARAAARARWAAKKKADAERNSHE